MNGTLKVKISTHKYLVLVLFLLSVYVFISYLFPKNLSYILLAVSVILLIFLTFVNRTLKITHNQLLAVLIIFVFVIFQLIRAQYSTYNVNSIKTAINRSTIFFIGAAFYLFDHWYKDGIKLFVIFVSIHVFFTIVSYLVPNLFSLTVLPLIPNHIKKRMLNFTSRGLYSGITEQIGRNASYISIGVSIIYSRYISIYQKSNKKELILLVLFFLSLLLTGKRGQLIAIVISMLFIYIYIMKIKGQRIFIRALKMILLIGLAIVVLAIVFPGASAPMRRFIERQGGDQTSGRIPLYINAIEMFKQKPIFGWGTGVFNNLYGTGTHNIYFQLLAEDGLIGFFIFVLLLIVNCLTTVRVLKYAISYNREEQVIFYLCFSLYYQVFYILYGLVDNPFNDGYMLLTYLLASSIPFSLKKHKLKVNKVI